jgi:hypothetical protein
MVLLVFLVHGRTVIATTAAVTGLRSTASLVSAKVICSRAVRVIGRRSSSEQPSRRTRRGLPSSRRRGDHRIRGIRVPPGVDVAFNLSLPSDRLAELASAIRPGRRLLLTITYPVPQQEWIGRDDVRLDFVLDMDGTTGGMREVGALGASGELPATIGRRYALGQGAQACVDFVRLHTTGKLVVTM